MSVKDIIESEAKAAEVAEGEEPVRDLSEVTITRGRERTEVLQVRLNKEEYEALRVAAGELPVSTFARGILLREISPELEVPDRDVRRTELMNAAVSRKIVRKLTSMNEDARAQLLAELARAVEPLEARVEALEKRND